MVVYPSSALSFFSKNLERFLSSCSQLYINCLAILLFIEMGIYDCCKVFLYCDTVFFYIVILFGSETGQFRVWF